MTISATPIQLTVPADVSCYESYVEIETGHSYQFSVTGKWLDFHDEPINANGNAHPGGIRELMGWAKRLSDVPWMALLIRSKGKNGTSDWQWVRDGDSVLTDLPAGKLQLCANDVVGFYWNNSKELKVTVTDVTEED